MALRNEPKSKRQPVPVDLDVYVQLRAYNALTGVPIARVVDDALRLYIATTMAARIEKLQEYCNGDRTITPAEIPPLTPSPTFTAADAMSDAPVLEAAPAPALDALAELPDWAKD